MPARVSSSSTTALISAVDAVVPLSLCSRISVRLAMIRARVVLPTPEGP